MHLSEPAPSRWELQWRMFGADFRVHPYFWISSALMGVYYYQNPTAGGVGVFVFWMSAVFVSILLHELGHVFAARLFGVRGRVYLSGLGGRLLNLGELRRWQRVAVLLMGPLVTLLLYVMAAVGSALLPQVAQDQGWSDAIGKGLEMLREGNFWWALLNLLPLWPLDGGQLVMEVAEGPLGRRGTSLAALLCIGVTGLLTVWVGLELRARLANHFHPLYRLFVEEFAILTIYCFILWTKSFRVLWGEPQPLDESVNKPERAA